MKTKPADSPDAIQLRKKAEAKLSVQKKKRTVASRTSEDSKRLVHELEVHQIELEMQNEELKQARAELEAALDHFTDLYDFAPVGYFTLSRDGVIQRANLAGTTLLGVERIRLIQKRLAAFVPAESYIAFNAFLQNVFSGVHKENCEIVLLKEGGEKIWAQLEGLRNESSDICWIAAMDISKRKQAEAERAKLAANVAASEEAVIGKTLNGIITIWNKGAQKMFGYTAQEVIGQSEAILVPEDYLPELPGVLAKIRQGETVAQYETVRVRKDGVRLYVSESMAPIYDEAGRVAAISSIAQDVTQRHQMLQELQEREKNLRAINYDLDQAQSVAHVGIWKWDLKTSSVEWSDEMYRIFGIDKNSYTGRLGDVISKVIHPDDLHVVLPSNVGEFASKKPQEYRIIRATDGRIRNIWAKSGEAILDEQGTPIYLTGIAQDITERKEFEAVLQESEEKYRGLFENMTEGYAYCQMLYENGQPQDWIYVTVNKMFEELTGLKGAVGKRVSEVLPGIREADPGLFEIYSRVALTGQPEKIETFVESMRRWFTVSVYCPKKEYFVSVFDDITLRKQAEESLRESESRFHAISESANDAIISSDELGNIVDWNPSAQRMFGFTQGEAHSQSLSLILPDRYINEHRSAMQRVNAGGEKHILGKTVEREGRRKDNSEFPIEISVSEWQVKDKKFYSAIIRDITERKQADDMISKYANELEVRVEERTAELVRANRVKDEFLANMSHELRTPLNSILGFSETLLEGTRGTLTARQIEAVEYVSSSGRHLLGLINDILDLSKIEADKFEIRPENTVVNDICMSSLSFIRQIAQKKMIDVEYVRQPEADMILADPRRLKQILINLLSNAVKFTPEMGVVRLEVRADSALGIMQFIVSDSGIGISVEDMKKLFKPFVQLDSGLSRRYEGTGLGLMLVKSLVELHGGKIDVESGAGSGSRFIISLPWSLQESAPQEIRPLEVGLPPLADEAVNARRSILLAEDNEVNILMLKEYLEHFGYHVIEARDGEELLCEVYKSLPDLILMDIQMPKLDGVEAILRLRADPKFESVPIVAVTALAMPGDRERLLEAGANEYISKPFRLQDMMKVVKGFLSPVT